MLDLSSNRHRMLLEAGGDPTIDTVDERAAHRNPFFGILCTGTVVMIIHSLLLQR